MGTLRLPSAPWALPGKGLESLVPLSQASAETGVRLWMGPPLLKTSGSSHRLLPSSYLTPSAPGTKPMSTQAHQTWPPPLGEPTLAGMELEVTTEFKCQTFTLCQDPAPVGWLHVWAGPRVGCWNMGQGGLASGCAPDCRAILSICSARDCTGPSTTPSGVLGPEEPHLPSALALPADAGARRLLFPPCSTSISTSMPRSPEQEPAVLRGRPCLLTKHLSVSTQAWRVGMLAFTSQGRSTTGLARMEPASQKAGGWSSLTFRILRAKLLPESWPQIILASRKTYCIFLFLQLLKTSITAETPGQLQSRYVQKEALFSLTVQDGAAEWQGLALGPGG